MNHYIFVNIMIPHLWAFSKKFSFGFARATVFDSKYAGRYDSVMLKAVIAVLLSVILPGALLLSGCQETPTTTASPAGMRGLPAVRLNFRYEADVPAPALTTANPGASEINPAIQADFDSTRTFELLDRTLPSPDKKYVLAVYRHIADAQSEYRLDMYSPDGKLIRKVTSDAMAVHFPDTIVWSPDSTTLAFVAMIRAAPTGSPTPTSGMQIPAVENPAVEDLGQTPTPEVSPVPTPAAPTGILTFRTEQIYTCLADGSGVKPLTDTEGLIYFYYAWSPDSTMLVSLAATAREWRYLEILSANKPEAMVPQGRPRVIEKNGRERRLDDNQTAVRPVWSPDSTKVAVAYGQQIRIYDAAGVNPTQAAIPLRNQLLISSQAYDRLQQRASQSSDGNINTQPQANATPEQPVSTLPDEKLLVSYNPIVEIAWTADDLLYFQTAYLRLMRNPADNVRSFSRWHRLVLSPQPLETPRTN